MLRVTENSLAGVARSTMSSKCAKSYSDSASRALPYQQNGGSTRKSPCCIGAVTPTPDLLRSVDGTKRLTPDSRWWHRVRHREITRSVA